MNADSDLHRLRQVSSQSAVELVDAGQHFTRSTQGIGGTSRGVLNVETVKRHQSVTGKLRVMTVGGFERCGHFVEELIENVQQVVGQLSLAQGGGSAQIDEQHRDRSLA